MGRRQTELCRQGDQFTNVIKTNGKESNAPDTGNPKLQGSKFNGSIGKKRRLKPIADNLADQFAQPGKSSQLNPRFVAEMMGFPTNWTELPFLNGEQNP